MTSREKELKAEIAQLKNLASNAHLVSYKAERMILSLSRFTQLQAKYNFSEQELLKAKDKENAMAVQLGRVESEVYISKTTTVLRQFLGN